MTLEDELLQEPKYRIDLAKSYLVNAYILLAYYIKADSIAGFFWTVYVDKGSPERFNRNIDKILGKGVEIDPEFPEDPYPALTSRRGYEEYILYLSVPYLLTLGFYRVLGRGGRDSEALRELFGLGVYTKIPQEIPRKWLKVFEWFRENGGRVEEALSYALLRPFGETNLYRRGLEEAVRVWGLVAEFETYYRRRYPSGELYYPSDIFLYAEAEKLEEVDLLDIFGFNRQIDLVFDYVDAYSRLGYPVDREPPEEIRERLGWFSIPAYVPAKLAGEVGGYYKRLPERRGYYRPVPEWGGTEREIDEILAEVAGGSRKRLLMHVVRRIFHGH